MERNKIDAATNKFFKDKSNKNPITKKMAVDLVEKIFDYKEDCSAVELYVSQNIGGEPKEGYRLQLRLYGFNGLTNFYATSCATPEWQEVLNAVHAMMTHLDKIPAETEHRWDNKSVFESGLMFF